MSVCMNGCVFQGVCVGVGVCVGDTCVGDRIEGRHRIEGSRTVTTACIHVLRRNTIEGSVGGESVCVCVCCQWGFNIDFGVGISGGWQILSDNVFVGVRGLRFCLI